MKRQLCLLLGLTLCVFLAACGKPAAAAPDADYGQIRGDFSGMTPEIAEAYLAVVDDFAAHLGYDEAEGSEGEYLHGGFVRDWDGDGTPELCLLLRTSPREPDTWDGSPTYGWYAPTLSLYTYQNGQAVLTGGCDLYFATAGREAAVAARTNGNALQYVRWDRSMFEEQSYVGCYELVNGAVQQMEVPAELTAASAGAETAQAFLDALGADKTQLLLYNSSGEAKLEGTANARALREALAAKAS